MARRLTRREEQVKRRELSQLYVRKNLTIGEIGEKLHLGDTTVYDRLIRLGISTAPWRKPRVIERQAIRLPKRSEKFAELIGILLGDGHISFQTGQIWIYSDKLLDAAYSQYVVELLYSLTGRKSGVHTRTTARVVDVFLTSKRFTNFLRWHGITKTNKVKEQVQLPSWIWTRKNWIKACIRGLFDTDGSIYRLRFGTQWSFTNRSLPLLHDTRTALLRLGFHPSKPSAYKIYLTRQEDLRRYFSEIGTENPKHLNRAREFGIL